MAIKHRAQKIFSAVQTGLASLSRLQRSMIGFFLGTITLLLPEWIFSRIYPLYTPHFFSDELPGVLLLCFFLAFAVRSWVGVFLAIGTLVLQGCQFAHFIFFKFFYGPGDI